MLIQNALAASPWVKWPVTHQLATAACTPVAASPLVGWANTHQLATNTHLLEEIGHSYIVQLFV
eukprot:15438911-Alexandrium_andersonii.AAC.1